MSGEGDRKGPKSEKNPFSDKFGVSTLRRRSKRTKPPLEAGSGSGVDMARGHATKTDAPKASPEQAADPRKVVIAPGIASGIEVGIEPRSATQGSGSPPSPWATGPRRSIDRSALP